MEQVSFARDVESGGLVNTDSTNLEAYKRMRERLNSMGELQTEINIVKDEILEIKSLLRQLVTQREG
jgi:hypothetical protein